MKPEKRRLLDEVLDETGGDKCRGATLLAANRILRHRRWKRRSAQSVAVMLTATLATLAVQHVTSPRNRGAAPVAQTTAPAATPGPIHRLSDNELLALFPDTPVGLVTLPDGRKRLIFPRPGDEQRFIVRL